MNKQTTIDIPAQEGRGFWIAAGQTFHVIDPEGQQVADMWAISANNGTPDWLSTSQTRDITERLFPATGDHFYSEGARPFLTLVQDNSPSPHDMLFPACNPGLYERAGLFDHPNCRDNFLAALSTSGLTLPVVPDPVNFFQRSEPQADGKLEVLASDNPPGGNVILRAETDLFIVITACSVDFHPTNGNKCTGIRVILN